MQELVSLGMLCLLSFHSVFPDDVLLPFQITGFSFLLLLEGWDIADVELRNHSLKPNSRRSRVSDSEEGSADTVRLPVRQCGGLHIYPSSIG